jgi:predicted TIM-barrel fold metal-dependent hydrolase
MGKVLQVMDGADPSGASRRSFLKGIAAAVGASAFLPGKRVEAQATAPAGKARAIDCHNHFGSPGYYKGLMAAAKDGHHVIGDQPIAGYSGANEHWRDYSPAKVMDDMERQDVATAVVSNCRPGVWFGDPDESRGLARDMNEYGARMAGDFKGKFGVFALLPLPNVDDCLKEIEYALDTLHLDGFGIFTSYQYHWLGDKIFQPVFDELNRRKAVVFVHPTNAFPDLMPGLSTGSLEFLTDTMRTIFSLLHTGAATRYGNVRFIFSHAGGAMPSLIERFGIAKPGAHPEAFAGTPEPNSNLYHLRRFYYDVANSCNPAQLLALKIILGGTSQMVFGSDYPIIQSPERQLQGLQKCGLSPQEIAGIHRGNAERLFPRLNGKA